MLNRVQASREFLERYELDGDNFLKSIVTGDETWVAHYTPETKRQSEQWRHTTSPSTKKFKTTISAKKIMAPVFWDNKDIILIEYLPQGETINAARYCKTLKKLRRAIQNKRRGLLTSGVCLLHDNARPHTANVTKQLLDSFGWDVLNHPPYSPDLASSDYHLFTFLKKHMGGKKFSTDEEVMERSTSEKYTSREIPSDSTLRKTYVNDIYEETMKNIREQIKGNKIWVSIDETTDSEGRYVANVIIGTLNT
ncbi:hypothetical protein QTP88_010851 [Uroleucon formosanum]